MVIETWLPFNIFSLKFHHMLACCSRDHLSTDDGTQKIFLSHLNAFLCFSPVSLVVNPAPLSKSSSAGWRTRLQLGNTSTCSYIRFDITKSSSAAGRTTRQLGNTSTCYMDFVIFHDQHNQQYHCHWFKGIHLIKIMKYVLRSDIWTASMTRYVLT